MFAVDLAEEDNGEASKRELFSLSSLAYTLLLLLKPIGRRGRERVNKRTRIQLHTGPCLERKERESDDRERERERERESHG